MHAVGSPDGQTKAKIINVLNILFLKESFYVSRMACDAEPQKSNFGLKLFFACFSIVITVVSCVQNEHGVDLSRKIN